MVVVGLHSWHIELQLTRRSLGRGLKPHTPVSLGPISYDGQRTPRWTHLGDLDIKGRRKAVRNPYLKDNSEALGPSGRSVRMLCERLM